MFACGIGQAFISTCFFFHATATPEIYPLSLHDALPISSLSWQLNIAADRTRQRITQLNTAPFLTGPSYAGSNDVTQIYRIAPGETFGVIYGTRIVHSISELYDDPAKAALSGPGQLWSSDSVIVNEEGFVVRKSAY